ncbi:hypothetical protein M0802_014607 [Mischocyttarus mexicanus]|nr:hypothetical protein M0802_014607 [Mischocyttarus mexicanus]
MALLLMAKIKVQSCFDFTLFFMDPETDLWDLFSAYKIASQLIAKIKGQASFYFRTSSHWSLVREIFSNR